MTSETRVDVLEVLADIWHRGLCSENVNDFEAARDAVAELIEAVKPAVATIKDYLAYEHDGDPWTEDARAMGEMDINDFATDGRLERLVSVLSRIAGEA